MSFGARGNSNGVHLHFFKLSAFYHRPGAFRYLGIFFFSSPNWILHQLNQGMKYEGYYEIKKLTLVTKKQNKSAAHPAERRCRHIAPLLSTAEQNLSGGGGKVTADRLSCLVLISSSPHPSYSPSIPTICTPPAPLIPSPSPRQTALWAAASRVTWVNRRLYIPAEHSFALRGFPPLIGLARSPSVQPSSSRRLHLHPRRRHPCLFFSLFFPPSRVVQSRKGCLVFLFGFVFLMTEAHWRVRHCSSHKFWHRFLTFTFHLSCAFFPHFLFLFWSTFSSRFCDRDPCVRLLFAFSTTFLPYVAFALFALLVQIPFVPVSQLSS